MNAAPLLLVFIYIAFISLGLPDSIMGVAWPTMRAELGVPLAGAGMVAVALTACSAISSVSSAFINRKFGTGPVVALSCFLTALGLAGYSFAPSFAWVLLAAVPLGFGQGAVDSSLNSYVASNYASRHMNWLHASWGIGATVGPLAMTAVLVSGFAWRDGYRLIAAAQGSLGILFLLSMRLWRRVDRGRGRSEGETKETAPKAEKPADKRLSGLRRPEPWMQVSLYALYCAAEISVGIWTVSLLVEARGYGRGIAGTIAAAYYGGITGGRVLTGFFADRVGNRNMVRLGLCAALAGIGLYALRLPAAATLPALVLIGIGFAPIFPCLMHETPRRFAEDTYRKVIGFQFAAAYLGGSILPGAVGLIAGRVGLEALVPLVALFVATLFVLSERLNKAT